MLTPLEEHKALAEAIGIERFFLKREDLTPTGSFKYRAAVRQIEHLVERGKKEGVISSSGNAAISLAHEARDQGLRLFTLLSPDISPAKLAAVQNYEPVVILSRRAMRLANYMSAHHRLPNLRPSVDDHAIVGFVSLGEEIDEQMQEYGGVASIVSFMTSGASMLGMVKGYHAEPQPRFVAVTSEEVGKMGTSRGRREEVAKVADILEVSKEDVDQARLLLQRYDFPVAEEAVASLAWIMKEKPNGNVVWVVSGKAWDQEGLESDLSSVHKAETFEEIDDIYESA